MQYKKPAQTVDKLHAKLKTVLNGANKDPSHQKKTIAKTAPMMFDIPDKSLLRKIPQTTKTMKAIKSPIIKKILRV